MNIPNTESVAFGNQTLMPVLFLGHGSPMNAIEENAFAEGWKIAVKNLRKPRAILCISAHWETKGTLVTAMEKPPTIHDFGGFPDALFAVQYPASGSPALAREICELIKQTEVKPDLLWGLDHGTWSVVKHMYPKADIPVVQLSLDRFQPPQYHYSLAKELAALRREDVLIVGSGNMVHNLRYIDWRNPKNGYEWAINANTLLKKYIAEHEHGKLINYNSLGRDVAMAVPTPEHFLPMLYILALQQDNDNLTFFNDEVVMGSLSMTSFQIS
jgi:4,5-DOPA dioxygenase extradiol